MIAWKLGSKLGFCHFFKFGSLVFHKISEDDSLEYCLTTIGGKTHEKNFRRPKLGEKLRFLPFSRSCNIIFPLYWARL